MKIRHLAALVAIAAIAQPALAKEHIDPVTGENVTHYEGAAPKDNADALKILNDRAATLSLTIAKEKLADSDMESVHEATYSLENAVDFLRKSESDANRKALDALDEAVQALHSHSENREEAAIREWYGKLAIATKGVQDAF